MEGKKIFLVGFMGSGKSTIAKLLANKLNLSLKDTDFSIEKRAGLNIAQIFEQHGETFFRYLEGVILHEILAEKEECIVSTGGGMPCFDNRINWMNKEDITVYLECSPEVLYHRIEENINERPLIDKGSKQEIIEQITKKLESRKPIYELATIKVNGESNPEEVVREILQKIKQPEVE